MKPLMTDSEIIELLVERIEFPLPSVPFIPSFTTLFPIKI